MIFLKTLSHLKEKFPNLYVFHQTGVNDLKMVQEEMDNLGIQAEVAPFFNDMEVKYREAQLVISRAGAGTLTELALFAMPSILIPYPFAADDHQKKNAEIFSKNGAAEIIIQKDLTPDLLAQRIEELLADSKKLEEMAKNARKLSKPEATEKVVDELERLCAGGLGSEV